MLFRVPFYLLLAYVLLSAVGLSMDVPMSVEALHALWPVSNLYLLLVRVRVARDTRLPVSIRRVWGAFAVAGCFGVLSDVLWSLPEAAPRLAEVTSLLDYVFCGAGFLLYPGARRTFEDRARGLMDMVIVVVATGLATWDSVLRPVLAAHHPTTLDLVSATSSPVFDLLMLAAAAGLLSRKPERATAGSLLLLAAGTMVYAVTDFVWASQDLRGVYREGGWLDLAWLTARLLVVLAAWKQQEDANAPPGLADAYMARIITSLSVAVPVVATALGFFFILNIVVGQGPIEASAWGTGIGAIGLCVLVLVRQTQSAIVQERLLQRLAAEELKRERLLLNILPEAIARRLTDEARREPIADTFEGATVLFADLVGFTELSAKTSPERLVQILDALFSEFDTLADRHGLEKIKTIGDAYMAAAGVPAPRPDHVEAAARMALDMRDSMAALAQAQGLALQVRIGIHTGPVVAGVIGSRKFIYDLWGDTVNTASRMESHGLPGAVHVTGAVAEALRGRFQLESRGERDIKGKGRMETHILVGPMPERGSVARTA